MFDSVTKEFKVGDKIVVKNWATRYTITVTRVTKLHAICEIKRKDGSGYIAKFKKNYSIFNGSNGPHFMVSPVPRIEWNTNEYTVISKDE